MKRAFLLLGLLLATGLPGLSRGAVAAGDNGRRWLQAELPAAVDLQHADCEQLAAAVGRVTLAHQPDAAAILRVALTRGIRQLRRDDAQTLPCACALRVFRISVAAAPAQASALLDLATEFYPACAGDFAALMRDYDQISYDYKDRGGDKNAVAGREVAARGTTVVPLDSISGEQPSFDPGVQARGDLSDQVVAGMGFGDINGFGTGGLSDGFPGSPNFVGSPPDGGLAEPPSPVTAAVNG